MHNGSFSKILHEVTVGLLAQRDLDKLLEQIVVSAGQMAETENGFIDLVDAAGNEIKDVVSTGIFREFPSVALKPGEGLSGKVWQSGQPLIINDYDDRQEHLLSVEQDTIRAMVGIPLKLEERVVGVLGLAHDNKSQKVFDPQVIETLEQFAELASLSINNVRLYQRATETARRRSILYRAAQDIGASLNLEQVYSAIQRALEQVMPCEDFIIDFYDEVEDLIVPGIIIELGQRVEAPPFKADQGLGGYIVRTGQSVLLNGPEQINASGIKFVNYGNSHLTQSILAVPMGIRGKITGMISVQSYWPGAYTIDDYELLEMLAAHAAIAIENARLFEEVQQLATTDSLTGLFNRRHFFNLAGLEFERAKRYSRPLSAMMMDVDHLKIVNDTFGHQMGDRLLSGLAKRCKSELRDVDIVGRYGGDEFAFFLPETDPSQAERVAERLLQQALQVGNEINPEIASLFTVSLGVAALDPSCPNVAVLIEHADRAMYVAKQAGRNRFHVWETLAGPKSHQ